MAGRNGVDTSRTWQFDEAASFVRPPQFRTMQQGAGQALNQWQPGRYNNLSVLDNYMASGTGYSERDRQRLSMDGRPIMGPVNGKSEDTWQKRQWLDAPYKTLG